MRWQGSPYLSILTNPCSLIKSFELAVKEIRKRKIKGAVAEVGVFRGEFAQYIKEAFPDSACYLFDTFKGFNANEALNELRNGNCTDAFVEAYKQTNIATVLGRMKHLNNIVIKQGFFPCRWTDWKTTSYLSLLT